MAVQRHAFQNFQIDHCTLLLQPELYNVSYCLFKIIFGVGPDGLLYEKRKEWTPGQGEQSMTFAVCVGNSEVMSDHKKEIELAKTIFAVVQPSEPKTQSSHVRTMLDGHKQAAHWQHIALRTDDLLGFYKFALERGVQFITPILKDDHDNLIQVFSGEWYFPGIQSSGMFFEFLQRKPSDASLAAIEAENKETWFRDKTFLGLYGEKEREYQTGNVTPFVDFELFGKISREIEGKKLWDITDPILEKIEKIMIDHAAVKAKKPKA
jgi:hypothetical protein